MLSFPIHFGQDPPISSSRFWYLFSRPVAQWFLATFPFRSLHPMEGAVPHSSFLPHLGSTVEGQKNCYFTVTTHQLWTFGQRVPPMHLVRSTFFCAASHQFSVLVSHIHGTDTQLLTLCPVFRCPGFATLPLRQTWSQLQFLFQPRPSDRSPSLSTVSSHCTLHTPCLPSWNSQAHYLLPL